MIRAAALLLLLPCIVCAVRGGGDERLRVTPVPTELRDKLDLDPVYKKHVSANGFPVLSSKAVPDYALLEAAYLINKMLAGRDDIRGALIKNKTRFVVMNHDELTTDVPEHSDLQPSRYWDRRARGLGATHQRPVVSCGAENLLRYQGDHYFTESILVHEFAHAIHRMGLNSIDEQFDKKLKRACDDAIKGGLWKDTYAATDVEECWTEGVQSWFDTNRPADDVHNDVDTREELQQYDAQLAKLIAEVFRKNEWRYRTPAQRGHADHLAGYDPSTAPRFAWPPKLVEWYGEYQVIQKAKRAKTP